MARLDEVFEPVAVKDRDDLGSNPSANRPLVELIEARLQRRTVLKGFVTAAAALLWSRDPALPAARLRDMLRASARDLGPDGQDPIFGAGLITPPNGC